MGYHFKRGQSLQAGLRRVAREQLDAALRAAADGADDDVPHELRKRCKKLRGLLWLVQDAFPACASEQRATRDAARDLAAVRESSAHLEALQRLERSDPSRQSDPDFLALRVHLASAVYDRRPGDSVEAALARATAALAAQRARVAGWTLDRDGFAAIGPGLVGTYRRARRALAKARRQPDGERLHELRKWVKYHRFHLDLLHAVWPGPFTAWVNSADRLGELLGQHHDLDVLLQTVRERPAGRIDEQTYARLAAAVAPDADALQAESFAIAARLLAEKPGCFQARLRRYWDAWRDPSP